MYSIFISHFVHPVTPSLHSTCSFASFELANTLPAYRSLYGILSSVAVNQPIRTVLHTVSPYMERPPSLICKQYHIWKWSGTDRHLATPCLNMSLHHDNTHTYIYKPPYTAPHSNGTQQCHAYWYASNTIFGNSQTPTAILPRPAVTTSHQRCSIFSYHGNTHIYINHQTQRYIQMARNSATPIDMQAIPYLEIVKRHLATPRRHYITSTLLYL